MVHDHEGMLVLNNSVTTGTKSQAQISFPWVFRNVDQDCPEVGLERTACIYFWMVRFATLIFNVNNSPQSVPRPIADSHGPSARSRQSFQVLGAWAASAQVGAISVSRVA